MQRLNSAWRGYAELDRRVWFLAGVRAVSTMGLSLVMTFVGIYLVTSRGLSAKTYGAIYVVANGVQSIAHGYAGELSDRFGRRPIMVWALSVRSLVVAAIGWLVLAEAPVPLLAAAIVASAALRGGFEPVSYAVVADVVPARQRVAAFGLQRMGTNLGWAIGPAIGGLLSVFVPYGIVFFCAAPILLACAFGVARMAEPPRAPAGDAMKVSLREAIVEAVSRADVALVLGCALVFSVAHAQLFSTMPIYATTELSLSKADIGLVFMVNGLAVLLFQVPAVALIARIRSQRALIGGAALYAAAFVGIGAAGGLVSLAGAVIVLTIGEVVMAPAQQALIADQSDPRRLGRAFGLLGVVQMAGIAVGPLVGGAVFDHIGHDGMALWTWLAVLPAVLIIAYLPLPRLARRAPPGG